MRKSMTDMGWGGAGAIAILGSDTIIEQAGQFTDKVFGK